MSEPSSWSQQHPGAEAEAAPHYSTAFVGVPGVRFVPSDQELIVNYLWPKLLGEKPPTDLVQEADVYEEHPKDLTSRLGSSVEGFWYVFSTRNRKYAKGKRPSRSTGSAGRWKAVGKTLEVFLGAEDGNDRDADGEKKPLIGHKCGLSYELFVRDEGSSSSRPRMDKTEWKMCEFVAEHTNRPISSDPDYMLLNEWVLCKISRNRKAAAESKIPAGGGHHQQSMDEQHDQEQLQTAPLNPSSQQAQAMPNMPYLPHHGDDGSDGTEVVQTQVAGAADLELPHDGDGGAMDVHFVGWSPYHPEHCWSDAYGRDFDHEWNQFGEFGAADDPDPMANRFQVPADPDSAVSPIELPSGPQPWDIASDLLFSDDGHELVKDEIVKANGDIARDNTAATQTPAPATASADSET